MNHTEFYKLFYRHRESKVSEAARLVLVLGYKQSRACKCTNSDKGSLSRLLRELKA